MAETLIYFLVGYAVIFVGLAGYLFSLWQRWQKVKRDMELLQ